MWLLAACGSALFSGATAVLSKLGVRETDSDLVTALALRERLGRRELGGLALLVAGTLAIAAA